MAKLLEPGFKAVLSLVAGALLLSAMLAFAAAPREKDRLAGPAGELEITFLGHGSLILAAGGTVVHVDPYSKVADYATLPKADLVLITHEHQDHLDRAALGAVPAYNIKHERSPGVPFHPRGRGNGYVVTMAGLRVSIAGDTENIPEMKNLAGIEVRIRRMP